MSVDELHGKLQKYTNSHLQITLRDNRSTYLSIRKDRGSLKLSLHRGFLYATEEVCRAVIGYSLNDPSSGKTLRHFSHAMFDRLDRSILSPPENLIAQGKFFDLQQLYQEINTEYFASKLNLWITWFKKPKYRNYRCITYGTYDRTAKLIRINQILDRESVPRYYVRFVIYHEMLHEVCPAYIDKKGRRMIHTPLFRQKEKEFLDYQKARIWEKKHGRS